MSLPRFSKKTKIFTLGFLFICVALIYQLVSTEPEQGNLKVIVLDIGQGDAIFIESPSGNQVLVDGGPTSQILQRLGEVMPFYDHSIDFVILTHPHSDHVVGLVDVLKKYEVGKILYNKVNYDSGDYREFISIIEQNNIATEPVFESKKLDLGDGVLISFLYPDNDISGKEFENVNNSSIVFRLDYGKDSFLLTGDAEKEVEEEMISSGDYLNIDILKVGHHGSKSSSTEEFLDITSPDKAVISCGLDNKFKHPHKETLDKLEKRGIETYRTDEDSDITFISDGSGVRVLK